jgi:hypothetical protein
MSRSSIIVLVAMRAFGILFAFLLAFIVLLSVLPGTPSITSGIGLINAPVYRIYTLEDGEISELYLSVGQEIVSGQDVVKIRRDTHERAFLLPLQLERVRLAQRAKQLQSRAHHIAEQLAPIRGQIAAAGRIARDELVALMDQAASEIRLEQARVARLEAGIDEKRGLVEIGLLGADALYAHRRSLKLHATSCSSPKVSWWVRGTSPRRLTIAFTWRATIAIWRRLRFDSEPSSASTARHSLRPRAWRTK